MSHYRDYNQRLNSSGVGNSNNGSGQDRSSNNLYRQQFGLDAPSGQQRGSAANSRAFSSSMKQPSAGTNSVYENGYAGSYAYGGVPSQNRRTVGASVGVSSRTPALTTSSKAMGLVGNQRSSASF